MKSHVTSPPPTHTLSNPKTYSNLLLTIEQKSTYQVTPVSYTEKARAILPVLITLTMTSFPFLDGSIYYCTLNALPPVRWSVMYVRYDFNTIDKHEFLNYIVYFVDDLHFFILCV